MILTQGEGRALLVVEGDETVGSITPLAQFLWRALRPDGTEVGQGYATAQAAGRALVFASRLRYGS